MMSFLVKHSSTAEGEVTIRALRTPSRRSKMSPYLAESDCRVWFSGSLRRWRWPIRGSEGGLGGWFFFQNACFLRKRLKMNEMKIARHAI